MSKLKEWVNWQVLFVSCFCVSMLFQSLVKIKIKEKYRLHYIDMKLWLYWKRNIVFIVLIWLWLYRKPNSNIVFIVLIWIWPHWKWNIVFIVLIWIWLYWKPNSNIVFHCIDVTMTILKEKYRLHCIDMTMTISKTLQ